MKAHTFAIAALAVLGFVLPPQPAPVAADDPAKEEKRVNEMMQKGLDTLLSGTLAEVEKRAKKGEKDGPTLMKDESKPAIGYYVYLERSKRSYYHGGKMVRTDVDGPKAVKDVLTKLAKPTKGPMFKGLPVPFKDIEEQWHWTFQTIVEKNDGQQVVQAPWTYTCELILHKDGAATVSFIDTERAEALEKALAAK